MKNLILASALALASVVAVSATSEAAPMHHRHHQHCYMKKVKHRVHGHWVVRSVRVCR